MTFPKEDITEKEAYLQSLAVILSAAARRADALAPRLHQAATEAAAGEEAMTYGALADARAQVDAVLALVGAVGFVFTVVSIGRSYALRRLFEAIRVRRP